MVEEIMLKSEKRDKLTKGQLKTKRKEGKIPAIIYGENQPSLTLFVEEKKFQKILHTSLGENVIINLEVEQENPKTVMIKEIQRNPLNDNLIHIDFQQISLTKKIELTVPLQVIGEAVGVKSGGILEQHLWELKIRCLPTKIPQSITVDVNNLELGKSISVRDLTVPKGVDILQNLEQVVVSVVSPPAVPEEVVTPAPTVAEPEVIGKGKKEKEEEIVEEKEEKKVKEVKEEKK
jgi:large subunit ribosomal protein L25